MTLGDFLNTLATKCGLQNDPALIDLLSKAELAQTEVDDELTTKFNQGLLSLEGAKNSADVLNHFKPILLKSADDKFAALASKYGWDADFANEKSTFKKIDLLASKLEDKIEEAKKSTGSTNADLTKQIAELQGQLRTLTESKDQEIAKYKADNAKQQLDFLINFELNGKRYANQELGDTNVTIARTLIDKALAERKAIVVNENGVIKLKQADNTSLDFLDDTFKPVTFSDFANRLLAEKHLLEVSNDDDNNPGGGGGSHIPPTVQTNLPGNDTARFDAAVAASLADLD